MTGHLKDMRAELERIANLAIDPQSGMKIVVYGDPEKEMPIMEIVPA